MSVPANLEDTEPELLCSLLAGVLGVALAQPHCSLQGLMCLCQRGLLEKPCLASPGAGGFALQSQVRGM